MTHQDKIEWMEQWATANGLELTLEGECGIMRECVGVLCGNIYPDYEWYDEEWERIDPNGEVFTPENAYHKHPCVAVLGRGENAEAQLYDWLKWFDDNGFKLETGGVPMEKGYDELIWRLLGQDKYARMVRQVK
jgi:hypothetical protein